MTEQTLLVRSVVTPEGVRLLGYGAAWRRQDGEIVRHAVALGGKRDAEQEAFARCTFAVWSEEYERAHGKLEPIPYPD